MSATTLHDKLTVGSANMADYGGTITAADFGDVRGEFSALLSGCGVYDLGGRAKVTLTGKDRVRWLNGMTTNNVRDLPMGRGVYAFILNPQGHILGDLYVYNRGDSLLLDTDQAQLAKVLGIFKKYIIMDQVEVTNSSDSLTAIGVAGPKSRAVLLTVGLELPELEPLQFADLRWRDIALTVVRGEAEKGEAYEIWLAPEKVREVWEALLHAGAKPLGTTALDLLRVAMGIPKYGQDIRERELPQETEQTRALNFTKGCYIGQEIVERVRSRGNVHRKWTGFAIDGPLPAAGSKIQLDGKDVGEITSVASLPIEGGDRAVALGYLRREAAIAGKELQAGNARATVAELPFIEIRK